jgi:mRNA (guanine-N7-)-methyltransferase
MFNLILSPRSDIARISVDQAYQRWLELRSPSKFNATFAALDCYTELISKALSPDMLEQPFDIVTMQFCMHYAFETYDKVQTMLSNVTSYLRPGGRFIGTIPNGEQLM